MDHGQIWGILRNNCVSNQEVLAAIQQEGLKVNTQKVQLVQQEVKYLGAILGIEGQILGKLNVELIQELPEPIAQSS